MNREKFVELVSKRINIRKCELFIGSGISCESGVPSWKELLKPLAEDFGISLYSQENLPMIAQYIVNANSGNRNVITARVMDVFNESYKINQYHEAIQKMNVDSIWTTNYDRLIEDSMTGKKYHVISKDTDLLKSGSKKEEIEIIKIHGSIDGDLNEIVLTQQDYDEFIIKKPAIAQRLRDTLIKKSFLFIGYGYNDPDIRTIMIEAMKMMQDSTQEHYIILLDETKELDKCDDEEKQEKYRYDLWKKELNRIGIRELVVKSKDELGKVLDEIALQSRGENIFVTGSHKIEDSTKIKIKKLGALLAQEEICLINGQSAGVGMCLLQGFMEECILQKKDLVDRLRLYPNPYAANSDYADNAELIPMLKKVRAVLMSEVKVFAFFKGGIGTKAEYEVACECGCLILPLIADVKDYKDELIKKFLSDKIHMKNLQDKSPDYHKVLKGKKVPTEEQMAEAIRRMVF